ncbi:T9SS type A sorting domain-containing protein [Hymenobacter sp. BT683]|uniref:T9SS type A sorting domain-containing protein n=1 Tax=Hymenobacter jeongseonensis TaxID=2791027 RepID=A0ABS0INE7_9BACT|nr:T9SS type A sorting domain-containing protein [Hymenobacter jeongseonensis]MBF9239894.1 T9SS type A sorting domain-containing protein [Hymenobacter jeongseonensis]
MATLLPVAPAVYAQCTFAVAATPAGPLNLCGGGFTLTAAATVGSINTTGTGFNSVVSSLIPLADGKLLVGGNFTTYNGNVAAPDYVARLNADGTLDPTFNAGGSGFDSFVTQMLLQPDGKILVAGGFGSYNGDNAVPNFVARLNTDGSLDASFNPGWSGQSGTGNSTTAIALQPDGRILIAGNFAGYTDPLLNRVGPSKDVLRLNANGSVDGSFQLTEVTRTSLNGAYGYPKALVLQPDGKVLVGGVYSYYLNNVPIADGIVRLNSDGSVDTGFNAGGVGLGGGTIVETIAQQPDGRILVGGYFTSHNGNANVPDNMIRLNANGSWDPSFTPSGVDLQGNSIVEVINVQTDRKILIGGRFVHSALNTSFPERLARLQSNGSLDASFNPGGSGIGPSIVLAVVNKPNGQILAGGEFYTYNGNAAAPDFLLDLTANGALVPPPGPVAGVTYAWSNGSTGPTLAVTQPGSYAVTATDPASGCQATSNAVVVTACAQDLVISNTASVPAGTYRNITVTGTGVATLLGNVVVTGGLRVETGGQLSSGCFGVSGPGTFTVAPGATLAICSPQGLSTTPGTGAVQTTGPRELSGLASYRFNGTGAQVTGNGLPGTVAELIVDNAAGLTLTQGLQVAQRVLLLSGDVTLNGQALTLLSSPTGTALVVNTGAGQVNGNTAAVQRYIDPSANPVRGYRHLSPPVSGATVAGLATSGFTPEVRQANAYNSSPSPGTVTPFPTVFAYDQARLATVVNAYAPFDRGFVVPTGLSAPLAVGRGYVVNAPGGQTFTFRGQLTSGDRQLALARNPATNANAGAAGWQLVGNPYPAPLDYARVAPGDRTGLEPAMYVFESSGPYMGSYRAYVNGVGNSLVGSSQGFFVRVRADQTAGSLTFRNAQRVTTYATQVAVRRPALDPRPLVRVELRGASGPADVLVAYAEGGASPAFEAPFDASKLVNPSGLNLASLAASGEALAIDGRPAFVAGTALALSVGVPAAGTYRLTALALDQLPAGLEPYLTDAATGQSVNLRQQASYAFSVTAAQALASSLGRFTLRFDSRSVLATSGALPAAAISVYPNPAHARFAVVVPAVPGATQVHADLLNALGQVVRRQQAALAATGARLDMDAANLAAGVYTLRVQVGATTLAKRIVIQ